MIYLDTAALVKLVRREPESDALADWLDQATDTDLVSSTLCEVELPRALRRTEPDLLAGVPALLTHIARYAIDDLVRSTAASYTDQHLRTLDAIHLATAHGVFGPARITAFVTYDRQLLASAAQWGLSTASPGQEPSE